jgi:hypothetical protein
LLALSIQSLAETIQHLNDERRKLVLKNMTNLSELLQQHEGQKV